MRRPDKEKTGVICAKCVLAHLQTYYSRFAKRFMYAWLLECSAICVEMGEWYVPI